MLINIGTMIGKRASSVSGAALFLSRYGPTGMAMDFSDASIKIDDATDVLDFSSSGQVSGGALVGPGAKLTYSAPSVKLTEQADGLLKFQAHNLYLNNGSPANQSITVLSGASYEIKITGTVSITLSGAHTGTVTAGTTAFTAATGTLTCGSTSGAGKVYVRRTPCNQLDIDTAGAAVCDLPYVYSGGVRQGIQVEPAATNLFLNNRAPVTQNITTTAQSYTLSFYGTGSITLSGTATATLNGTGAANRVQTTVTATAGTLTCTVSGTIDLVQFEAGTVATSPIITYVAAVARAADSPEIPTSLFPYNVNEGTLYIKAVLASGATSGRFLSLNDNVGAVRVADIFMTSATAQAYYKTSDASQTTYTASATPGEQRIALRYKLDDYNVSYNGTLNGADTATGAMQAATMLEIGHFLNSGHAPMLVKTVAYLTSAKPNATLQAMGA